MLARMADEQGVGRQTLHDIGVKLADLTSAAAAVQADVRDGQRELSVELRSAGRGLAEVAQRMPGRFIAALPPRRVV